MNDGEVSKIAFANVNSKFNDAKARASQYCAEIQKHIDNQKDWFPEFNGYPLRGEAIRLTEMEELTNELFKIRERFCKLEDMW